MFKYKKANILPGLCFAILACFAVIPNANATTPDTVTPANEGVCDTLKASGGGLYGLCVAYCEAQDLDMFDKEPPSTKILENYRRKMQPGDPDMPCVKCVLQSELDDMVADGIASCNRMITNKISITDNDNLNLAEVDKTPGRERCRFVDVNTSPMTVRSHIIATDLNLTVTAAERAQMYFDAIDAACQSIGK